MSEIGARRWEQVPDFPEAPPRLSRQAVWQNAMSDTWQHPDNILVSEARVLVKAAERIGCGWPVSNCHVLLQGDDLAVISAF